MTGSANYLRFHQATSQILKLFNELALGVTYHGLMLSEMDFGLEMDRMFLDCGATVLNGRIDFTVEARLERDWNSPPEFHHAAYSYMSHFEMAGLMRHWRVKLGGPGIEGSVVFHGDLTEMIQCMREMLKPLIQEQLTDITCRKFVQVAEDM